MERHERWPEARGQAALADETPRESKRRTRSVGPRKGRPRFDVVGIGALNLDHLYEVPQLIEDGGIEVLSSTIQPGGSAANTIYGLAKLGLRCGFVGVVGDDDAGKALMASFEEVGVDTSGIRAKPGAATGQTICVTAGQGQKAIYIIPGANGLLDSDDIDLPYVSETRYVHLSSFVGEHAFSQQTRIVEKLPPKTRVSFALDAVYARRGLKAVSGLLGRCALLLANANELRELTGQGLPAAAHTCLNMGCEVVVVTFGSGRKQAGRQTSASPQDIAASIFVARQRIVEHTVPAVKTRDRTLVDTTGAGDAFAVGFLFGLLQGKYSLPMCGALGHTAAGFSLTALGARAGLPTGQDLLARFDEKFGPLYSKDRRRGSSNPRRSRTEAPLPKASL
jgi:ribokinase